VEMKGGRITGGDVQLAVQGGSALVYVNDEGNRESIMKRFKEAFANVDGVAKIVGVDEFPKYGIGDPRHDPHAPDLVLFAKMNYYFGETAPGKKELKGSHGYDSYLPDMYATFVAWGAGIKPGAKLGVVENTSVAPTVAKLLGVEIPNAEGRSLNEALAE
jgi:predicted AlkP superfamily pyrophosphatase or phosphodiesterase